MKIHTRRAFLNDVSKGMLLTGLGPGLASQLGVGTAFAEEGDTTLDFGDLRPLVHLMQDNPGEQLQPKLVKKLNAGETDLPGLIAAAALANAETFGGQDYVGYHTEMALVPALEMAARLPEKQRPLPVLKVLYRNADRIQGVGGATKKTLKRLHGTATSQLDPSGQTLRAATRGNDMGKAEALFAAAAEKDVTDAYNQLQYIVQDDVNVHRFVLGHRIWELVDIVGAAHAHTILRQSVRFCVDDENRRIRDGRPESPIRTLLPKLITQHGLESLEPGDTDPGERAVGELADLIYSAGKDRATDAVAAALADGISVECVGEAISLAANQLVLRQAKGRAHGASRGVHGSDAVNAWRNIARATSPRNALVGMLVAAYHTADYSADKNVQAEPLPHEVHLENVKTDDPEKLLASAAGAIRDNDQAGAAAAVHRYGYLGHDPVPVFGLMLDFAISEDGRLHAEKFFQTVVEEYATTRPAYRWRQLVACARVTASSYGFTVDDKPGFRAPGYEAARKLLAV